MSVVSKKSGMLVMCAMLAVPAWSNLSAQELEPDEGSVLTTVYGSVPTDLAGLPAGPDIAGIISSRSGAKLLITLEDGSGAEVSLSEATEIRGTGGFLGMERSENSEDALLNGLPVDVKTLEWGRGLVARQIKYRNKDLKTVSMIQKATAQQFAEQGAAIDENAAAIDENAAATEALRSRLASIDEYNIKDTTNVYFDSGKWQLTNGAKRDLCAVAAEAEALDNALLLVVGYTDSTGSPEFNQVLSERRAGGVVNYLQQTCRWKPWRMLSPTGMAEADPQASNTTEAGKAQNRRVSVNILVSKSLDGK